MSYVPDMYCDARGDRSCTIVPGLSGGCITVTTEGYFDRGVGLERSGTQADLPGPLKQAERPCRRWLIRGYWPLRRSRGTCLPA